MKKMDWFVTEFCVTIFVWRKKRPNYNLKGAFWIEKECMKGLELPPKFWEHIRQKRAHMEHWLPCVPKEDFKVLISEYSGPIMTEQVL